MQPFIQASYRMWNPSLIRGICPIRSAGHYIVQPGFRESPMRKDFFELFWTAKGCGYFQLENEVVSLGEGEVFCYFPGDYHVVFSGENHWEYYWLTLSGKDLSLLLKKFAFSREPRKIGSCPVKLFNDLISQLTGVDFGHAILATSTCYALLNQAANPVPEDADNFRYLYL